MLCCTIVDAVSSFDVMWKQHSVDSSGAGVVSSVKAGNYIRESAGADFIIENEIPRTMAKAGREE